MEGRTYKRTNLEGGRTHERTNFEGGTYIRTNKQTNKRTKERTNKKVGHRDIHTYIHTYNIALYIYIDLLPKEVKIRRRKKLNLSI